MKQYADETTVLIDPQQYSFKSDGNTFYEEWDNQLAVACIRNRQREQEKLAKMRNYRRSLEQPTQVVHQKPQQNLSFASELARLENAPAPKAKAKPEELRARGLHDINSPKAKAACAKYGMDSRNYKAVQFMPDGGVKFLR